MALRQHTRLLCWIISATACAILVLRLALHVDTFSPTNDEPADIGAAVSMYEAGKSIAGVSHPPLARWVPAYSLYLDGIRLPECRGQTTIEKEDVAYALGTRALYSGVKPAKVILRHARLLMLIFPILTLLYLHLLTRHVAGDWPAALAVVFFSLDPTLLGHGLWVCDDVAAGTGFLAGIYYTLRWLDAPTLKTAAIMGVAVGLAIAIKFNCLLLLPIVGLMILLRSRSLSPSPGTPEGSSIAGRGEGDFERQKVPDNQKHPHPNPLPEYRERGPKRPGGLILHSAVATAAGLLCLWATYLFNVGPLGDQNVIGHPAAWEHLPAWVRNTPVPMPSFFLGLARQMAHNHLGQTGYLNGQTRDRGWWYYFPEVLVLKTPLSVSIALAIALVLLMLPVAKCRAWFHHARTDWRGKTTPYMTSSHGPQGQFDANTRTDPRSRKRQITILLPPAAYLLLSMFTSHLDLGVRYMLPILPLLYAFIAIVLVNRRLIWLLCLLITTTAIETAFAGPDYLAYFNLAAGSNPTRFAADSNIGWGEDIYLLADWIRDHHTTDYAIRLSARRHIPLLREVGLDEDSLNREVHGRLLFLDINARLIEWRLPWITRYKPIAKIGSAIEVYDLRNTTDSPQEPNDPPPPDDPAQSRDP